MSGNKPKRIYKKCMTPKFRAAFANVFKAKAIQADQDPIFSMTMLFDEAARQTPEYKQMQKSAMEAAQEFFGQKLPKNFNSPFKDPVKEDKTNLSGFDPGVIYMATKSKDKPQIIDTEGRELITQNEFASGDYARATITFSPYDYLGKKGLTVYLNNIQMLEQGERFSGRASAADDFSIDTTFSTDSDNGMGGTQSDFQMQDESGDEGAPDDGGFFG